MSREIDAVLVATIRVRTGQTESPRCGHDLRWLHCGRPLRSRWCWPVSSRKVPSTDAHPERHQHLKSGARGGVDRRPKHRHAKAVADPVPDDHTQPRQDLAGIRRGQSSYSHSGLIARALDPRVYVDTGATHRVHWWISGDRLWPLVHTRDDAYKGCRRRARDPWIHCDGVATLAGAAARELPGAHEGEKAATLRQCI